MTSKGAKLKIKFLKNTWTCLTGLSEEQVEEPPECWRFWWDWRVSCNGGKKVNSPDSFNWAKIINFNKKTFF